MSNMEPTSKLARNGRPALVQIGVTAFLLLFPVGCGPSEAELEYLELVKAGNVPQDLAVQLKIR